MKIKKSTRVAGKHSDFRIPIFPLAATNTYLKGTKSTFYSYTSSMYFSFNKESEFKILSILNKVGVRATMDFRSVSEESSE